jgi:hypothetical protein
MLTCVCLRILASSRIPQYDLGRQTPHFWGGSVTWLYPDSPLRWVRSLDQFQLVSKIYNITARCDHGMGLSFGNPSGNRTHYISILCLYPGSQLRWDQSTQPKQPFQVIKHLSNLESESTSFGSDRQIEGTIWSIRTISLKRGDTLKILIDALPQLSIRCNPPDQCRTGRHRKTHMVCTIEHVTKHLIISNESWHIT